MNYKYIVAFASGMALGGAIGAFVMYKRDIKEVNKALEEIRNEVSIEDEDLKDEENSDILADPRPEPSSALKESYIPEDSLKTEYSEEEFEQIKNGSDNKSDSDKIYVISEDQYYEKNNHFGKEHYYFYTDDGTLLDDDFDRVLDPENLVGANLKARFAKQMGEWFEDDPVYIRNEALGMDFEITPRSGEVFYE